MACCPCANNPSKNPNCGCCPDCQLFPETWDFTLPGGITCPSGPVAAGDYVLNADQAAMCRWTTGAPLNAALFSDGSTFTLQLPGGTQYKLALPLWSCCGPNLMGLSTTTCTGMPTNMNVTPGTCDCRNPCNLGPLDTTFHLTLKANPGDCDFACYNGLSIALTRVAGQALYSGSVSATCTSGSFNSSFTATAVLCWSCTRLWGLSLHITGTASDIFGTQPCSDTSNGWRGTATCPPIVSTATSCNPFSLTVLLTMESPNPGTSCGLCGEGAIYSLQGVVTR